MCAPLVMMGISLAISAASAVASSMAANEEADAQRSYQEAQMKAHNDASLQNANAAIKEQNEQMAAERIQQMQHGDAAAREKQKIQKDFLEAKGTAMASSPYGTGLSFDNLMADYNRAFAMNTDVVDEQLKMQGVASDINVRAMHDQTVNRIASQQGYIPAPIKEGPSLLSSALGFAGDAFGAYNASTNFGKDSLFQSGAPKSTDSSAGGFSRNYKAAKESYIGTKR